jgi:hypothetical protein
VTVTGRFKLGNRRGDSHTLTIQWVHVGDPLDVHTHYIALPLGNAYNMTILYCYTNGSLTVREYHLMTYPSGMHSNVRCEGVHSDVEYCDQMHVCQMKQIITH